MAQSSYYGRHFFITFPDTTEDNVPLGAFDIRPEARLILFSDGFTNVTITTPSYERRVTVEAGWSTTVSLNEPSPTRPKVHIDEPDAPTNGIFEVKADRPIGIYCYFTTASGTEAYTALPVESWGTEYTLVTLQPTTLRYRTLITEEVYGETIAPVDAVFIAAEEGTVITVTPGIRAATRQPKQIVLGAGQAYMLHSLATDPKPGYSEDLSGSKVTSNRPIGVISGSTRGHGTLNTANVITGNTVKNPIVEWLVPSTMYGQSFSYRPLNGERFANSGESIDLSAPGTSRVAVFGSDMQRELLPGGLLEIPTTPGGTSPYAVPLTLATSEPAQAMVVLGTTYDIIGDAADQATVTTNSRAMAELLPRERWMTLGRFNAPDYPTFLSHYVAIVAESKATILLDGSPIPLTPSTAAGVGFNHALMKVTAGDHTIRSTGGTFSAIAFGGASGMEAVWPGTTRKDDDGGSSARAPGGASDGSRPLHVTYYQQVPAPSYAFPVVGPDGNMSDHLTSILETCDSTVITLRYVKPRTDAPLLLFRADNVNNVRYQVDTIVADGFRVGYRIIIRPADPARDGSAEITATDPAGVKTSFPYVHHASRLAIRPAGVNMIGVLPSTPRSEPVWIRNDNPYPVTIDTAVLLKGTEGFLIGNPGLFPATLKPGDSMAIDIRFLSSDLDRSIADMLVLAKGCRSDSIPLRASIRDDISTERTDRCDSTIVTLTYVKPSPASLSLVFTAPKLDNTSYRIDTTYAANGVRTGYRIVFRATDPGKDASGELAAVDQSGFERRIPYSYRSNRIAISPASISLTDVTPATEQQIVIQLRNDNPYPMSITGGKLASGFRGFRIRNPSPFPVLLKPGESIDVTLLFLRAEQDQSYDDELLLAGECRSDTVHLHARTGTLEAGPYIGGHDWNRQWVASPSPCTKNEATGYPAVIDLYNAGEKDLTVERIELVGPDADAGIFLLDVSDPATTVRPGELLRLGDTIAFRLRQRVIFRPAGEQEYRCIVRLITTAGDTVEAVLEGTGIESHLTVSDYLFAPVDLSSTPVPVSLGVVRLKGLPTRPVTIRDLRFTGPGRARYWIDPADSALLPRTLAPDEEWSVRVMFLPSAPGTDSAGMIVVSDASRCDDSVAAIIGSSYRNTIAAEGSDLGSRLACVPDSGRVRLVNNGSAQLLVRSVTADPAADLAVDPPPAGTVLRPGETLTVVIRFGGRAAGAIDARVLFEITDLSDGTARTLAAPVRGRFFDASAEIRIDRDYHVVPGQWVHVPILLSKLDAPAGIPAAAFTLRVRFNRSMLRLLNGRDAASLFGGTLLDGWGVRSLVTKPGMFEAVLAPSGAGLTGTGRLANLRFETFVGDSAGGEVEAELTIEPARECVTITSLPGRILLDSICGLSYRLIRSSASKFALGANRPNPFNPSTEIDFSIGLDGPVRLTVMNALGELVETLVDAELAAGSYTATWDATTYPSGLYYYRIISPGWSETRRMMLVK